MKTKTITAVSLAALMFAMPAIAANTAATENADTPSAASSMSRSSAPKSDAAKDIQGGLRKADESLRETADDIHAFIIGDGKPGNSTASLEPVLLHRDHTAHGMIGATVIDPHNNKIATVKDIIIEKDGKARLIVLSDGGVLGIGSKLAAFDYGKVVVQQPDGKIVMALNQDMIDHAADFSYDPDDAGTAKIIPAGTLSVKKILDGIVLDSKGDKAASIENVYFNDGSVSSVIVGFNKTLGMGGDLAALNYDSLQVFPKKGEVDFKMSANQSAQFRNFRKTAAK